MDISYDGKYPNLCHGRLFVTIDGKVWEFPDEAMRSGGSAGVTRDFDDYCTQGPWEILLWPDGFPEDLKSETIKMVNDKVPWGCCGGCI